MATLGSTTITSLTVFNNTTLKGTLGVAGTSTFTGKTTHNDGIQTTTLSASGNTTIGGTLGVTGNTTIGGTLGVTGATTLKSTLGVTGNTTIGGTLGVTGATTLKSTLGVTGNTTIGGTLEVSYATTLKNTLTVDGNTTLNGNVTLGNAEGDVITVNGDTNFKADVDIDKTLNVDGNTTLNGNVTLGNAEGDIITVKGDTIFNADVDIDKTLNVDGNTTLNGNVTLGNAEGDAITVKGDTNFKADVDIDKTLNVDGNTTLNGNVTLGNAEGDAITVKGDTNFKADVDIDKTLNVDGNTTIGGTLTVGTTTTKKETTLNGQLNVVGNIVQTGGNIILDSNDKKTNSSGTTIGYGDTPRLIFRRGGTTDSYNDWDMFDNSAGTFLLRKGTSATAGQENTWKNIMVAKDTEVIFSDTVTATTFNGALTGNVTGNVSGSSGSCTGNAASATKLATARTISIGTGATGTATSFNGTENITIPITDVKEAYLTWGGRPLSGSVSPVDAAMDGTFSANRLSFMPADDISVKYSTDSGTTWTDYGLTDAQKISLVTTGLSTSIYPGKKNTTSETATTAQRQIANSDQVQVTLTASANKTYFSLKKIYIYVSTQGGLPCKAKVDYAKVGSELTWINHGTYTVAGWSGWNSIPLAMSFGGGATQTSNIRKIRIRFYSTGYQTDSGYGSTPGTKPINFTIFKIAMHGETIWNNSGGNLSSTGHLYSWDASKNATFPAEVTASKFVGTVNLKGSYSNGVLTITAGNE